MSAATTIARPEIEFAIDTDALEERTTVVHCRLTIPCLLRISPDTWLLQDDGRRRALVGAYGIVKAPAWNFAAPDHCFTLVFEGLSSNCRHFDLLEDIEEPYPFHFTAIPRNRSDVYQLEYPNFPLE
ncbi:MAG: hypothetical protein EOP50_21530 [Sphingobacteriales bacterium]|nr:MAG: hypothetical protein EOP50_21530 [Sphingobacteriales bacterium]